MLFVSGVYNIRFLYLYTPAMRVPPIIALRLLFTILFPARLNEPTAAKSCLMPFFVIEYYILLIYIYIFFTSRRFPFYNCFFESLLKSCK